MNKDEIKKEALVYLDTNPAQLGALTGKTMAFGDLVMVQVDWGANAQFEDIEHLCIKVSGEGTDIGTAVGSSAYGTIQDLRRRMTYEKLQGTLTDVFYSMSAAQIDFMPHQFKPVLRFVDSPTNRLLIADEVGLGKTIETGLIWLECQARFNARRLLVVCPAMLCLKWQRELRERFQLDVIIADIDRIADLLNEFDRIGNKLSFNVICSYNALRPLKDERPFLEPLISGIGGEMVIDESRLSKRGKALKRMADHDGESPFADLVVFDEATVMKNTTTTTHVLGRIASSESGACLCLSATPIHNKSRDLFALLRMVDPDYFHSEFVFDVLRNKNNPVVHLLNLLTLPVVPQDEVLQTLQILKSSEYFSESAILRQILEVARRGIGTPADLVTMFNLAEKLNLLSGYVCRTRKSQISKEGRVQRRPVKLTVSYTDEEMRFYQVVLRHIRSQVRQRGDTVTSFHTIGPALRMASCLPVMAELLRGGRWGGIDELVAVETSPDNLFDEMEPDTPELAPLATDLGWIRNYDFEAHDSKYQRLLNELVNDVGEEKIILFAFFKDTLKYLARRLTSDGIKTSILTGDVTDQQEREDIIDAFQDTDIQVLLCSEVGAEGIDMQFCRTIVNYDLPWNPMRVEQRIGRVDRIGQKAKTINVINFCINGTIDGLIYTHLYEKIGIFHQTIGDLESIIGTEISRLTADLLRDELTQEEEIRLIEGTKKALEECRLTENELEKTGNDLVAYSDYLSEQVGNSRRLGRYVKPSELRLYLGDYFAQEHAGCRLDWDTPETGCGRLVLTYEAAESLAVFIRQNNLPMPSGVGEGTRGFTFTLDPAVFESVHRMNRHILLINHLHPLVRWVTKSIRDKANKLHKLAAVRVVCNSVPSGRYFFLVRRLTLNGLHPREHLFYAMRNTETGIPVHGELAENALNEALERGESLFPGAVHNMMPVLEDLRELLNGTCQAAVDSYKDEMDFKRQVQIKQVKAHFCRKIEITEKQIASMSSAEGRKEHGIILAKAKLESLQKSLNGKLENMKVRANVRVSSDDVVGGILEIAQ